MHTALKLLVVHLEPLDFSSNIGRRKDDDHTSLDRTGLASADRYSTDSTFLIDILTKQSERLVVRSNSLADGIDGLQERFALGLHLALQRDSALEKKWVDFLDDIGKAKGHVHEELRFCQRKEPAYKGQSDVIWTDIAFGIGFSSWYRIESVTVWKNSEIATCTQKGYVHEIKSDKGPAEMKSDEQSKRGTEKRRVMLLNNSSESRSRE